MGRESIDVLTNSAQTTPTRSALIFAWGEPCNAYSCNTWRVIAYPPLSTHDKLIILLCQAVVGLYIPCCFGVCGKVPSQNFLGVKGHLRRPSIVPFQFTTTDFREQLYAGEVLWAESWIGPSSSDFSDVDWPLK